MEMAADADITSDMQSLMKAEPIQALNIIYDRYAATLYGLISKKISDEILAEGVLIQCFKIFYKQLEQITSESAILPALICIARKLYADSAVSIQTNGETSSYVSNDTVLKLIIDEGHSVSEIASKFNIDENEIKLLLRKIINTYKHS